MSPRRHASHLALAELSDRIASELAWCWPEAAGVDLSPACAATPGDQAIP